MHDFKISVITVSFNAQSTIERSIQSVISQNYDNVEYIIIDGRSSDSTVSIAEKYRDHIKVLVSEPDKGIYDAMNKGIALATGDVVGILNADDFFANEYVLTVVVDAFKNNNTAIVYGDLNYIKPDGSISRKWVSGEYKKGIFNLGWMPPHPTFYCRRELFGRFGNYSLAFGTAADYELMLRYIHRNHLSTYYVKQVLVQMSIGGVSNHSIKNRARALLFDMKAMYENKIFYPPITLIFKPLRKLKQFF
ncbi:MULTISPECIES: glycosyltransferase family 2 protein [unclassified Mucilaginibacter]|uniref:glycosyltransferase family 2 protein n=1 Tax=unclassified Mucilaginibacter TaxID=2617802 RepID=UPI002AC99FF0|nr:MULTISPECIES: glycosyltransferase family 2 protein [unclassified Mucilaginibacter]MEB0260654.1 glycosyltransferase family 2 protein [Mucilaginibacter sp. 10I4]MEB0277461.1 glycosyltransferase family 2 protein [Mucilaginibacter sp. 10B2]MEB0300914.1 glycosyltransferase family 2 protein [Mucilaginibacter sp. 5C4]WPX24909.1 glycosyltransferase family 2 protein [Mucilaginibacter sp. 5C4]